MNRIRSRFRRKPEIPDELVTRIDQTLAEVEEAGAHLRALGPEATVEQVHAARLRVDRAYRQADEPLRAATAIGKQQSYGDWIRWRRLLSALGSEYQEFLFAWRDHPAPTTTRRMGVADTAMSYSAGDHQHAEALAQAFRSSRGGSRPAIG